jgi:phage tail tape-measure protein
MSRHDERAPDDALQNHPLRDTQEFESDIRARAASAAEPRSGAAGAVGGAGGALAGAGLGTILGGPIGAIVGAIAGAVGGWWAGQAAADSATTITPEDEARYRALYDESPNRLADGSYEDVRAFYHLGHVASRNPDYQQRTFDEVEGDLQKGWTADLRSRYGDWSYARQFAREAYSQRKRVDER